MVIQAATLQVEFAPPVQTAGLDFADRASVVAAVREAIAVRLPQSG